MTADTLATRTGLAFTTTRAALTEALSTVAVAVHTRPAVPALSGVLLTGDTDGTLTATGFDYSTAITVTVPDVVTTPGRALLTHADLSGMLAATAKGTPKKRAALSPVTVTTTGDGAAVAVDGYTLPIESHRADDFPVLPAPPPDTATVDTTAFVAELSRVTPAAVGPEWSYPVLENVRLTCDRGRRLDLVATDRYRIAWATLTATSAPGVDAYSDETVLVNARLLDRLRRHLTGETVTLALGDGMCGLVCGRVRVLTRGYSESDYPKMTDLVPDRTPIAVTADRAALARATDRARAILTAKKETATPIAVTIADGAVSIGPDLPGTTAPDMDATTTGIAGEPVRLRFNARYLADALASFTDRTATVHLTTPTKPVVITDGGATPDTAGYRHLLMPIRPQT
ncbi:MULTISPECIES: hypothetical protein [unclassified Nocardiopsis]|uniref:hypothetical protein n=1 Tax=Nocardiopsis TaxID=2013 RepID=UPI00387ADA97